MNGGREQNNNFLLDGVDNNYPGAPGPLAGLIAQNPDSTNEFRVLTNNFAPEFGRNNGAIINMITQSGTNDFHGSAFYFGRWDALGARDYFNHQINPETGTVAPKNPYVRNLYGGTIGGPIKKNRTFFFISYQGDRFITTLTNSSIVPTTAFKSGVFTYTNPATGASQALNVTMPGTGNNGTGVGLDPLMQKIFALYPTPNIVNPDGTTGTLFFPSESREKDEDPTIKIDHKLNKDNNLYIRYSYNYSSDPNPSHTDDLPGDLGAISSTVKTQGIAIGLTSPLGSTLINEFRFGANRANSVSACNGVSVFDNFGFIDGVGRGADFGLPIFAPLGCQTLGDTNEQSHKVGTYQWFDGVSKVLKSHTFKWGVEIRDVYSNNFTSFSSRALFTFNVFTDSGVPTLQGLNPGVDSNFVEDEVGALLGLVDRQTQTQFFNHLGNRVVNDERNLRQHEIGTFWQDSWKLVSNLTLTYGLRWEWYGVPYDAHANLSNQFARTSGPAPFTFTLVGPGTGHQLFEDYYKNFEPRFGFAWDPFKTGGTSVRGGVGVFSDRIYGNLISNMRGNPPFEPSFSIFPTATNGTVPAAQLQNQAAPAQLTPSPLVGPLALIFPEIFANNAKPPLVVSWNLGIQRGLAPDFTIEANYVGNHGTRILRIIAAIRHNQI